MNVHHNDLCGQCNGLVALEQKVIHLLLFPAQWRSPHVRFVLKVSHAPLDSSPPARSCHQTALLMDNKKVPSVAPRDKPPAPQQPSPALSCKGEYFKTALNTQKLLLRPGFMPALGFRAQVLQVLLNIVHIFLSLSSKLLEEASVYTMAGYLHLWSLADNVVQGREVLVAKAGPHSAMRHESGLLLVREPLSLAKRISIRCYDGELQC